MLRVGVEEERVLVARDGTPRSVVAAVLQYSTSLKPESSPGERPSSGSLMMEVKQERVETSTQPRTHLDAPADVIRGARADASARQVGARIATTRCSN